MHDSKRTRNLKNCCFQAVAGEFIALMEMTVTSKNRGVKVLTQSFAQRLACIADGDELHPATATQIRQVPEFGRRVNRAWGKSKPRAKAASA